MRITTPGMAILVMLLTGASLFGQHAKQVWSNFYPPCENLSNFDRFEATNMIFHKKSSNRKTAIHPAIVVSREFFRFICPKRKMAKAIKIDQDAHRQTGRSYQNA